MEYRTRVKSGRIEAAEFSWYVVAVRDNGRQQPFPSAFPFYTSLKVHTNRCGHGDERASTAPWDSSRSTTGRSVSNGRGRKDEISYKHV